MQIAVSAPNMANNAPGSDNRITETVVSTLLFACLAMVCACRLTTNQPATSAPVTYMPLPQSGARLRITQAALSAAVRVPFGFFDTLLDEPCTLPGDDCVPALARRSTFLSFYPDAMCAGIQLATFPANATAPRYGANEENQQVGHCSGTSTLVGYFRLGPELSSAYLRTSTGCVDAAANAGATRYFTIGESVAMVSFTTQQTDTVIADRLHPLQRSGSDGTTLPLSTGYFDSELDSDCTFQRSSDGTTTCEPVGAYPIDSSWFLDATCTQPAFVAPFTPCPQNAVPVGKYAFSSTPVGGKSFYRITRKQDPTYYYKSEGACLRSSSPLGVYALDVEPVELVTAAEVDSRLGDGRIRIPAYRLADGSTVPAPTTHLHDAIIDDYCTLVRSSDDKVRCMPTRDISRDPYETSFFADSECQTRIDVAQIGTSPFESAHFVMNGSAAYRLTTPLASGTFYQHTTICAPVNSDAYHYLEPAPDNTFAEVAVTRDP